MFLTITNTFIAQVVPMLFFVVEGEGSERPVFEVAGLVSLVIVYYSS